MNRPYLLILVLFALNIPAHAGAALRPYNTLEWRLDGTTWCFEDSSGPWDHGRIAFKFDYVNASTAFYDVTDGPGSGGIDLLWATHWDFNGWTMALAWGEGRGARSYTAHVDEQGEDRMVWTFLDDSARVSKLKRCDPKTAGPVRRNPSPLIGRNGPGKLNR